MSATSRPLVICYDDSNEARAALDHAAELLPGARALVVTLWKRVVDEAVSPAARPPISDPTAVEQAPQRAAEEIAAEGAYRAELAGLDAEGLAVEATGALWEAVEKVAEAHDALLVVCGTDRSGMRSSLPGHLPHALVSHVSRPVLVVPSPKAALERRREAAAKRRGHPALAR
jgi:nucleotide-binding universal stress UspA family protein